MVLLTEGGRALLLVYKYGPPDGGRRLKCMRTQELAIPGHGLRESLFQRELRTPAKCFARLGSVQVLMSYLVLGLSKHFQLQILATGEAQDQPRDFEHRHLNLVAKIESLTRQFSGRGQLFGQHQVSQRSILHVEVITNVAAIAANNRALAGQRRANRPRHYPVPVRNAATVEIPAARHAYRQPISLRVALSDEISARFADVVRMTTLQRGVFGIRQSLVTAISFVGRGYYDLLYGRRAAASFEHRPRAPYVGFKSADWISVGDADDGLCGQMKHGVDLVLAQHALDCVLLANVSAHHRDSSEHSGTKQLVFGEPVAYERDYESAAFDQGFGQPAAEQACSSGDQHWSLPP